MSLLLQFKKINQANSILSDEKKREIYDKYGSMGLYIAEQFGDDVVGKIVMLSSKWFQCLFATCCCLTGCCCCCCCCGCFNFCCGKCKPDLPEDEETPDIADFEDAEDEDGEKVVTSQPGASSSGPTVIVMPANGEAFVAKATSADEPTETTALKNEQTNQTNYTSTSKLF
jgi:DnaJ family protein C protein 5